MTAIPLDRVFAALHDHGSTVRPSGSQWSARCPAHDDHDPSLSIGQGDDGRVLLTCHTGCEPVAIARALGLSMADLFVSSPQDGRRVEVAAYRYTDEQGTRLYEVVRYHPKDFRQRRPDGRGGHVWNLRGVRRVLFRLPEVIAAVAAGGRVWLTEGEKDALALQAALPNGEVSTTGGGAGKWRPEYAESLRGAVVLIWADADEEGRRHAKQVAAALDGVAASVRLVESPHAKDAADHLAKGYGIEDVVELTDPEVIDRLGWQPTDLRPILAGAIDIPRPSVLLTRDGATALFYAGMVNGIHGDSGIGKSWLVDAAIAQELLAGRRAILLDFESTPSEVVARLRALAVSPDTIATRFTYIKPDGPRDALALEPLHAAVTPDTTIVGIDSVGEAFGEEGIDENVDAEVAGWVREVARPIAERGPAVVLVDHPTKAHENPWYPSGSKRKRASITGASYLVEADVVPTRDRPGILRVKCAKDRHGTYATRETVATVDITPWPDGGVSIGLHRPCVAAEGTEDPKIEQCAKAAVAAVEAEGRELTRGVLEGLIDVKASNGAKRAGIDLATGRGLLHERDGGRGARLYSLPSDDVDGHEDTDDLA